MSAQVQAVPAAAVAPNAAAFVAKFERHWSAPSVAGLVTLLTDDAVLMQPLLRTTRDLRQAQAAFAALLNWVPDLRAQVDDWCAEDSRLFIHFRLSGTYAGRYVEWPAVDRIVLRGEFACERISFFDPSPVLRAVLTRPAAWLDVLRSGLWRNVASTSS